MAKIGIIVPAYNVQEYLHYCVESILSQDYGEWHIYLVDDGSADNTPQICDEYAAKDNRITVIHKLNGGLSSARNAGIERASEDYLMFIDGDDYLSFGALSSFAKLIESSCGDVDFIHFGYTETLDYSVHSVAPIGKMTKVEGSHDLYLKMYELGGEGASACTKIYKRNSIGRLRFKEGIIHEDEQFTAHYLSTCTVGVYVDYKPYIYVQRPQSIITSSFSNKRLDLTPIMRERIGIFNKLGYNDLLELTYQKYFANLVGLYVRARLAKNTYAQSKIKQELCDVAPKAKNALTGRFKLICIGIIYHLPVLTAQYLYNKYKGTYGKN
jgi:glycosyltransferase involved in cell wall biosynthesis